MLAAAWGLGLALGLAMPLPDDVQWTLPGESITAEADVGRTVFWAVSVPRDCIRATFKLTPFDAGDPIMIAKFGSKPEPVAYAGSPENPVLDADTLMDRTNWYRAAPQLLELLSPKTGVWYIGVHDWQYIYQEKAPFQLDIEMEYAHGEKSRYVESRPTPVPTPDPYFLRFQGKNRKATSPPCVEMGENLTVTFPTDNRTMAWVGLYETKEKSEDSYIFYQRVEWAQSKSSQAKFYWGPPATWFKSLKNHVVQNTTYEFRFFDLTCTPEEKHDVLLDAQFKVCEQRYGKWRSTTKPFKFDNCPKPKFKFHAANVSNVSASPSPVKNRFVAKGMKHLQLEATD